MKEGSLIRNTKKFVAYYRVSTDKQGQSGLGLEAQRDAVLNYVMREHGQLLAEYTEVESGAVSKRPELMLSLAKCKQTKAILVIAKLDRLSRNVYVISGLLESGVEFVATDNPTATKLMLHMLAAFAEHEREQISARTKAALSAAKKRGVKLGTTGVQRAKENREAADAFALQLATALNQLKGSGISTATGLARGLNNSAIRTWRGGHWHPATVIRLVTRLQKLEQSRDQFV